MALAASILCLASAFALGTVLVNDAQGVEELAEAGEGDDVSVRGDLHVFQVPDEGWDHVRPVLRDATYRLDVDGMDALVLVTGLAEGLEPETVVVEGDLVYSGDHPADPARKVFVLLGQDVHEPAVFR